MQPATPEPYGHSAYARPASPVYLAKRIECTDGASLATFVYGPQNSTLAELLANDPMLVLHGNGGSHATFVDVIDTLTSAGKGVIAFDARLQGQSTGGTRALTYELLTEDAVGVLDSLHVNAAHVVGHSDGGIVALLMARDYPSRVLSIVAGGANLTPEGVIDEWDTPGSVRAHRAWAEWLQSDKVPETVDVTLLPSAEQSTRSAELLQLMIDEPHIDAESLGVIRCPACILVGENDCIARSETEAIARAIPGARLVTVRGVGHSVPRQAPDSVACQALVNVILVQQATTLENRFPF